MPPHTRWRPHKKKHESFIYFVPVFILLRLLLLVTQPKRGPSNILLTYYYLLTLCIQRGRWRKITFENLYQSTVINLLFDYCFYGKKNVIQHEKFLSFYEFFYTNIFDYHV